MNAEQARDIKHNMLWQELVKEIDKVIGADKDKLVNIHPDGMVRVQERIKAFEFVKQLPQAIVDRES